MRNQARLVACTVLLAAALPAVNGCGDDPPDRITGPGSQSTPLRLVSVSPTSGRAGVSTAIALNGAGFNNGTTLTLGGISVPVTFVNSSTLRATAPPHGVGSVNVVLTNANGERAELTNGFRYVDTLVRLEITGTTTMQSVGETGQLTATATFSDGTSMDVTRETAWTSEIPSVAAIEPSGVVTARALGMTRVFIRYPTTSPSLFVQGQVTVTPPGTYALSGRVREPGAGSISVARITHVDTGQVIDARIDGFFALGGLTGRPRLRVSKDGYEDAEADGLQNTFVDAPLQRVVRIAAGAPQYASQLAPNDMELAVGAGARCQPCRLIRVTGEPGAAQVTLQWSGSATLQIWVNGRAFEPTAGTPEVTADINIGAGETLVFVGRPWQATIGDYIQFNLVVRQ